MSSLQDNQPQTTTVNLEPNLTNAVDGNLRASAQNVNYFYTTCVQHRSITIEEEEPQQPIGAKEHDFKSVFGESDRILMMEDRNDWDNNQSQVQVKSRQGKQCFNVKCQSTKNIRKLKSKAVPSKYRNLCNTCYQDYINNQFCQFCEQIYKKYEADDNNWIGCDHCDRWNHVSCQYEKRSKNAYLIKQENSKYSCLNCTLLKKEKTEIRRQKPLVNQYHYQYEKPRSNKRTIRQQHNQQKNNQYFSSNPNSLNIFSRPKQITLYLDAFLHSLNNYKLGISDYQIRQDFRRIKEINTKQGRGNEKGK